MLKWRFLIGGRKLLIPALTASFLHGQGLAQVVPAPPTWPMSAAGRPDPPSFIPPELLPPRPAAVPPSSQPQPEHREEVSPVMYLGPENLPAG